MANPFSSPSLLFTAGELGDWLGIMVSDARATVAERVVWGWLQPVLGAEDRPDEISDQLFSWAIELGAIAHENPAGLSSQQLGTSQRGFSSERRTEILADVAGEGSSGGLRPRGSFPAACAYPDPAY